MTSPKRPERTISAARTQAGVEAVLEAHAHEPPGGARRLGDAVDVGRADAGRLLDHDVGARLQARDGQLGQAVVGHRHHEHVEVLRQQRVQRREGHRAPSAAAAAGSTS